MVGPSVTSWEDCTFFICWSSEAYSDQHMTSHLLCLGGSVKGYESVVSPFEAVKTEEEASQGGKEVIRVIAFIDILIC